MANRVLYKSILDKRSTGKKVPLLLQTQDDVYDSIEKAKSHWSYISSNVAYSTTDSSEHIFKFSRKLTVSDMYLYLRADNSAAFDVGYWAGCRAIEEIEVKIGKVLYKFKGEALQAVLNFFNAQYGHTLNRVDMRNLCDAGSGDINNSILRVSLGCLVPGSSGILGEGPSQPINLSLSEDQPEIKIKLRAGNLVSKTNPIMFDRVRLYFREWEVDQEIAPLLNRYSMLDACNDKITSEFVTQNTELRKELTNLFDTSGQKEYIGMFVSLRTNANVNTEFEAFIGQEIESLQFEVLQEDLYNHEDTQEAKLISLFDTGVLPYDAQTGWNYFIPFKHEDLMNSFQAKGTPGVSLSGETPTLYLTSSTTTGTHILSCIAVAKCNFQIENGVAYIKH